MAKENLEENGKIKPNYYVKNGVECQEMISVMTEGKSGIEAFALGNIIKYLWRYADKNGIEDIRKAETYLSILKKAVKKQDDSERAKLAKKADLVEIKY